MSQNMHYQPDNYNEFVEALLEAGFSTSGGNPEGVYTAVPMTWNDKPDAGATHVRWFSGDPDIDPWEWRYRLLNERGDVAYAKMFFRKGGYVTREWYPYFLAARRDGMEFAEEYENGTVSFAAKRIYSVVSEHGATPVEGIKRLGGFTKQEKSRFESALTDLQMGLYITICGSFQKRSKEGYEYGWSSNVYDTAERFWGASVFDTAARMSADEAYDAIEERIYKLNPGADPIKVRKFILG